GLGKCYLQHLLFDAAQQAYFRLLVRLVATQHFDQFLVGLDRLVTYFRDHIINLEARLVRRTIGDDDGEASALVLRVRRLNAEIAAPRSDRGRPHAVLLRLDNGEHHIGIFAIPVQADTAQLAGRQTAGEPAETLAAVRGLPQAAALRIALGRFVDIEAIALPLVGGN